MGGAWNRNVASLTAFNALRGATVGGFMALLPMYMKHLGYSMDSIGGVIAASSLAISAFLPPIGYVIDRHGPRLMVALTGLLLAVAPLIAAYSRSLAPLGVAYGLFLFSFLAGQPARMSFLAASVDGGILGSAVGLTSSAFSASRTAGPALAGILAKTRGFQEAFLTLTLATLAGLTVFALLSRPVESPSRPRSVGEAYRYLARPPRRFALLLGYVSLDRFAWSLWFPMLSAHLYAAGYQEDQVGYIITMSGVVQTLLLPATGRVTDKLGSWAMLAASEASGVAAAALYSTPEPWQRVALAAALLGFSFASWIPAYNALVARVAGGSGGAYAAANTARSLMGAPAPYLGGYLYDAIAPWAPFTLSALLLSAATAYAATILRRVEKPRSPRAAFKEARPKAVA